MASVAGIVFSNLHDKNVPELTSTRTMAAVPMACRYRLIDFALSNMVNANITNISVITHYNYHSLMEHIGSGKDWDLARRRGGIKLLPPFINAHSNATNTLYSSRLEALQSVSGALDITEKYVVLSDCDSICSLDINKIVDEHIKKGSEMTIVVHKCNTEITNPGSNVIYHADEEGNINGVDLYNPSLTGEQLVCTNVMVMNTSFLFEMLLESKAHNYQSFLRDVVINNIGKRKFRVHIHDGFFANIKSLLDYYNINLRLAQDKEMRDELFSQKNRPIFTKVRNSPPAKYNDGSVVKNSLIADGCVIDGVVENSILFRRVKVGKGTVIKNSILFQDTLTGENVYLNCVVTDKSVVVRDGVVLSGHETLPFYIEKGKMI